jgi:hypothetical protein
MADILSPSAEAPDFGGGSTGNEGKGEEPWFC